MKVFVATGETQGQRKNDFLCAEEGEMVIPGSECDGEAIDGACGCRRSFSGLTTRKGTTTAKVVEVDMTPAQYCEEVVASEKKAFPSIWDDEFEAIVLDDIQRFCEAMQQFPVGAVVEKRGNKMQTRLPQ